MQIDILNSQKLEKLNLNIIIIIQNVACDCALGYYI